MDDLFLLGDVQVVLGILFLCMTHRPSHLTQTIPSSSFMSIRQVLMGELCKYVETLWV
jgi:hypothetical protein